MKLFYNSDGTVKVLPVSALPANAVWNGGFPYTPEGSLLVSIVSAKPTDTVSNGGFIQELWGGVCAGYDTPSIWIGGLAITSYGALCLDVDGGIVTDGPALYNSLTHTAIPTRGSIVPTFTRATTSTWPNNDGYMVTGVAGEIGFVGARRVRNLLPSSEDLTSGWTATGGTLAAGSITESGATSGHYAQTTSMVIPATAIFIMQAEIKQSVGTRNIGIGTNSVGNAIFNPSTGVFVANDGATLDHGTGTQTADGYWPVWVKVQATTSNKPIISLYSGTTQSYAGDGASQVLVRKLQLEDVTAQTTQTSGEYVSVGVESAPYYHGSMVDGVKCFPTDLAGNALPTSYTYDAVSLNGVAGTYVSTPDSVAASITGDIDIRCEYSGDWTPSAVTVWGGKFLNSGQYSWRVYTDTSGTKWHFQYSIDGTAAPEVSVTATAPFADNVVGWWRVTRESVTGYVNFYTSPDGAAWTPLGTQQTGSAGALYNGTDPVQFGTSAFPLSGKIYRAQIYNGIDGTLAVDFDASRYAGGTTLTGSTGETWTLQGNAVIHPTNNPMLGYLAEGAATNLCLQSQTIATAPWQIGNGIAVTADQYVAPDGTTTVDKLTALAGNTQHFWYQGLTTTAGAYTYSVYLRYVNNQWARIGIYDGAASYYAAFDILNGVVGSTVGPVTTTAIEPMADGVTWRVSLTATIGASALSQIYLSVVNADDPSFGLWNATGTEAIGVWGAQLNLGAFAGSYTATTTAAVARNADVLTYSGGDIPNLKTLCATFRREVGVSNSGYIAALTNGTLNELAASYMNTATQHRFNGIDGAAGQWDTISSNAYVPGASSTVAWSAATNDVKMAKDGVAQTADTGATMPTVTQLEIGCVTGAFQLNGTVGGIYGWTRNLSQSELGAVDR